MPTGSPKCCVGLGWYEDANGLALPDQARAALDQYATAITGLDGGQKPASASIKGLIFPPAAVVSNGDRVLVPVEAVVTALRGGAP